MGGKFLLRKGRRRSLYRRINKADDALSAEICPHKSHFPYFRVAIVTIINVILLIFSLICFIGTAKNNDDINSMTALAYEEVGNGKVIVSLDGKEVAIGFGENSVRVAKSYKVTSKKESISSKHSIHAVPFAEERKRGGGRSP